VLSASIVAVAQDDKKPGAAGAGGMPSPEEMAKMMEMMGKIGEEHKKLAETAGTWDADVKFWMDPSAPPQSSSGTMKWEPIWDGRYMKMTFEGSMDMGGQKMPFQGLGYFGYDNAKQVYWSTWMDSMSTGLNKSEGKMEGDKIVMHGVMYDPMTKQEMKTREVTTFKDKDHMTFEMFGAGPDGKEMKMMEINYTRKK
jgi:hypothetical protein